MSQLITNLNEIDFLPEHYSQRTLQRRAGIWRVVIAIVFGGFLAATTWFEHQHHARVQAKVAEVDRQYAEAMAHNARFAELQASLQDHRQVAELLTFLRHPWPRTQIMAAVIEPLPDSITLIDWQISREKLPQTGTHHAPHPPAPGANPAPLSVSTRRAHDLKRLAGEQAEHQYFVYLTGHATEAAALHEYLARLGANPLFAKIDLRSIEHAPGDPQQGRALGTQHFTARAILRLSPGLPPLPKPNPAGNTTAGVGPSSGGAR